MQISLANEQGTPFLALRHPINQILTLTEYNTRIIVEVCHKINVNFRTQISMPGLVEEFNLTEAVLTRRFKFVYKQTIYQYRMEKIMQYALERMGHGASLKHISKELGYCNYRSFARAFKKVFGQSPKNLR